MCDNHTKKKTKKRVDGNALETLTFEIRGNSWLAHEDAFEKVKDTVTAAKCSAVTPFTPSVYTAYYL